MKGKGDTNYAPTRTEGACNMPNDQVFNMRLVYCSRPDNGSGLCNVHQAAKKRGEANRERAGRRSPALYKRPQSGGQL